MTNKIITNKELYKARYEKIAQRYKKLKSANPDVSHNAICRHIADEVGQTTQNIDRIIRITGNYRTN